MLTNDEQPTVKGPAEWFTGDAWIDAIAQPHDNSSLNVAAVHFTPGARTAWHSHAGGQTLYVTEGRGLIQSRGHNVVAIRAGDTVWTPNGEEHWHGATQHHFMTHLSLTTGPATWRDHVTDAEHEGGRRDRHTERHTPRRRQCRLSSPALIKRPTPTAPSTDTRTASEGAREHAATA
jgi:quercetin dioxygenase-like cupin family protein